MHIIASCYYLTLCTPTAHQVSILWFRMGWGSSSYTCPVAPGTTLANCKVEISLLNFCKPCTPLVYLPMHYNTTIRDISARQTFPLGQFIRPPSSPRQARPGWGSVWKLNQLILIGCTRIQKFVKSIVSKLPITLYCQSKRPPCMEFARTGMSEASDSSGPASSSRTRQPDPRGSSTIFNLLITKFN